MVRSQRLKPSHVFIRIRPQTSEGGHAQHGQPSDLKMLQGWDDDSVTIGWTCEGQDDMGRAVDQGETFGYMDGVLEPDITQDDMFSTVVPPMLDKLLGYRDGDTTVPSGLPMNTMLFAYGQTGTGKTFTTLGPDGTLHGVPSNGHVNPRWGIFPRVAYAVFNRMATCGRPFVISFSAVEFYLGSANDLLLANNPVALSQEHELLGLMQVRLHKPDDIIPVLSRAIAARHTRHTRMNIATKGGSSDRDEHSGSSRGHALFNLSVIQFDPSTSMMVRSTFHLVDLAGAERPDKTGAQRVNGPECWDEMVKMNSAQRQGKDYEVSVGAQAFIINYELYTLGLTAVMATEYNVANKFGRPYRPGTFCTTDVIRMLGSTFGGSAYLSVIVTLSQAPQCGWETWFSCKYGRDLAKLRAPLIYQEWVSIKCVLREQVNAIKSNTTALARPIHNASIKWRRMGKITEAKNLLVLLRGLVADHPVPGIDCNDAAMFDLPKPVTTGFTVSSVLQDQYELVGQWCNSSLETFLFEEGLTGTPESAKEFIKIPIRAQRKMIDQMEDATEFDPINRAWLAKCREDRTPTVIDTTRYPPCDNGSVAVYVHRPADLRGHAPAMVYTHGGGGLYCRAKHARAYAARVAAENGIVVFNVEYRLAPEAPAPAAIFDAVGVVLYLHEHASKLGIDPTRIGVMGDSAGGWIATGTAMELAKRNLSRVLRLCVASCPMVSDIILRGPEYPRVEGGPAALVHWKWMEKQIVHDKKNISYLWITKAGAELFTKFPRTAIITGEFDVCRRMSEELGAKLRKADRLVEYVCYPGVNHCWYAFMSHPRAEYYYRDLSDILNTHLVARPT